MATSTALTQIVSLTQETQARGVLSVIGHAVGVVVLVILVIGILIGLVIARLFRRR